MKQFISLLISLFFSQSLMAQTGNVMADRIIRQLQICPQEKTYVHTDASDYEAGDRIWMKVYVVDALSHEPNSESMYAYVELISDDGSLVKKVKLLCRNGIFAGYIDIPNSVKSGTYLMRSYTSMSQGVANYCDVKPVYIGNVASKRHKKTKAKGGLHVYETEMLSCRREKKRIIVETNMTEDSLTLLAHCRAYPFFIGKIAANSPVVFAEDALPQGILSLLLVNKDSDIVAERLLFSDNGQEQCRVVVAADKEEYDAGDDIKITFQLPDLHQDELADLSMSAVSLSQYGRHMPSSIVAGMFVASETEGGVACPERYIGNVGVADSMLRGKKWRRYDFENVLKGIYKDCAVSYETSQVISGRVQTYFRRKPIEGANVSLIAPQVGIFAAVETDSNGCFSFPFMDYPEGTKFVLRAVGQSGKENVELFVDEKEVKSLESYVLENVLSESGECFLSGSMPESGRPGLAENKADDDALALDNIDVVGTRRNSATKGNVYAQLADFSFGLQKIEEIGATCLHELFRHIPGIYQREGKCYVRAASSIYGDTPAAIAIDGVIVSGDYDLDIVQMQDVARVDVFKGGSTLIWGSAGGCGVISITTKTGVYGDVSNMDLNQKRITPEGYQHESSFYLLPGKRKTLYWNPSIRNGNVVFSAVKGAGDCLVVVEGVTTEGRLIHEEMQIKVR